MNNIEVFNIMKKKLAVITILTLCIAAVNTGCSREKPVDETLVQTETSTEAESSSPPPTQETTIEPFEPSTKAPETTTAAEQERNNRLIIATDIHYLAKQLTDGKEAFTYMVEHGDGKLANYVREITDAFIEEVIGEKPQAVIISGDLTLNGEKPSHKELAEKLYRIEEAGIPVVVIPGNHDINNPAAAEFKGEDHFPAEQTTPADFEVIYKDFGYGEALSRDTYSLSYTYQLDDFNRLLMLDSCQYEGTAQVGGMIKLETYDWIEEQLELAWNEGMNVIPVSHHNLMDESQVYVDDCTIEHSEELQQMLCDWHVPWYLSGHLHVQHFKSDESYGLDEVVTSSLSTAPCQYGVIDYKDDGSFRYQTRAVDMAAWAKRTGSKNRHLLNFPEYSKKMLERVFYNKVMDTYKYSDIPRHDKAQMANLYAKLNVWSYAGRAVEVVSEVVEDPAYQLWEQYGGNDILYQYIQEIVHDATQDYNYFERS